MCLENIVSVSREPAADRHGLPLGAAAERQAPEVGAEEQRGGRVHGDLRRSIGQTLQGAFSAGWLAGNPDYLQKLKVPEGYEKRIDYSNI